MREKSCIVTWHPSLKAVEGPRSQLAELWAQGPRINEQSKSDQVQCRSSLAHILAIFACTHSRTNNLNQLGRSRDRVTEPNLYIPHPFPPTQRNVVAAVSLREGLKGKSHHTPTHPHLHSARRHCYTLFAVCKSQVRATMPGRATSFACVPLLSAASFLSTLSRSLTRRR